ncbi:MAG: M50 family metallopeptidase [Candidatus Saccharibacteria bacterium]|nr:M50 family metallopeptidase [Candidatus Saccharibacteria bacterium]MCY4088894.1 M50 family metallopeptidase [Candidatus Saccharibacteria bacterium]
MEILIIVIAIILFQLLIILHEYGHFLVAKRNGIEVEEFGLGFPPRLFGKTLGKGIFRSYYSLNLLPIGGFVKLKGENDESTVANGYGRQNLWVKTKVILAGIIVNLLIATLLFTILAFIGIPKLLPAQPYIDDEQFSLSSDTHIIENKTLVYFIAENSQADLMGIKIGDELISMTDSQGQTFIIDDSDQFYAQLRQLAGQTVSLEVRTEDDIVKSVEVPLRSTAMADEDNLGVLGVATDEYILQRNTWSAPLTGIVLTGQYTKATLEHLWLIVTSLSSGETDVVEDSVGGPVSIVYILQAGASNGFRFILMIIALLSLTLAIMNALPIPALDGGRLMLTLLFRKVLKKPLTKRLETKIIGISMILLLTLMVGITILDIQRIWF